MKKPLIVVVGSSNTDMIIKVKRIPRAGETVLGGEFMSAAGGKGANQAVAASRAGGQVSLIARVGSDVLGDRAIAGFVKDGIDVSGVTRDRRLASGTAFIFVAGNGENSIAVASGANARLSPADVTKARAVARAKVLLMQLETPLDTVSKAARLAVAHGALVILNPAPARSLPNDLLRYVSILTPNQSEAELLTGIRLNSIANAEKAAEKLRRRGVRTVVLTLGARGALIADERGTRLVSGFKVKAVDTTAAGDTFNGALAVALAEGQPIDQAVLVANAAAAISVTRWGAQPSAPTRREIRRLLKTKQGASQAAR
ncbi:MAG TPA: ribokinase [Steroidobacter sp.]